MGNPNVWTESFNSIFHGNQEHFRNTLLQFLYNCIIYMKIYFFCTQKVTQDYSFYNLKLLVSTIKIINPRSYVWNFYQNQIESYPWILHLSLLISKQHKMRMAICKLVILLFIWINYYFAFNNYFINFCY